MVESNRQEQHLNILRMLSSQVTANKLGKFDEIIENEPGARIKTDFCDKQGWGYHDHGFILDPKTDKVRLLGTKYDVCEQPMPNFKTWVANFLHLDFDSPTPAQPDMEVDAPKINEAFVEELGTKLFSRRSFEKWERVMNSHGQTLHEIWELRQGKIPRVPDMVFYPSTNEHVEHLVKLAEKHDVVLIPCGGNSNVTHSLMLDRRETRMIVAIDMLRMNKILWVDKRNNMMCAQAGIYGQDLERQLKENFSVVVGHEPDSIEFSTLGGWISTRASGMKKNVYGNIEDIVQNIKIVTCKGTLSKVSEWPRHSSGLDLNQLIMGQEGNFGCITEVILRIRPLPEVSQHGSFIFPSYEVGAKFMEEVGKSRMWPASLRLVDNIQFQFGQAMKTEQSTTETVIDAIKKFYVTKIKGYNPEEMVAATVLYEGTKIVTDSQQKYVQEVAAKYQGLEAGAQNGLRGYFLTYVIAYIRDLGQNYNFIAESFETSCPWNQVVPLSKNVTKRVHDLCEHHGVKDRIFVSFRVTQLYETGAAVYVYFGFNYAGVKEPLKIYDEIEWAARDEIIKQGGCVSHHHGVGKIRKGFSNTVLSKENQRLMRAVKMELDPKNIFAISNTINFEIDGFPTTFETTSGGHW